MEQIWTFVKKMTLRQWGLSFALLSALILAAAFISQYGFGMQPCKLCLYQRWPYGLAIVLGGVLFFKSQDRLIAHILLALLAAVFLFNAGLAFFHVGVEYHWWTFSSDCTATAIKPHASVDALLQALRAAPVVRCDERHPFLFGMTMAFYNVLICLGLAGLVGLIWYRDQRSSSLSQ